MRVLELEHLDEHAWSGDLRMTRKTVVLRLIALILALAFAALFVYAGSENAAGETFDVYLTGTANAPGGAYEAR